MEVKMLDYETKENYTTTVLGKCANEQEALKKLNNFFAQGWFEKSFSENSIVILVESSFLTQRKEHPIKITGSGKNRIATFF
jgi:hypothetical protein